MTEIVVITLTVLVAVLAICLVITGYGKKKTREEVLSCEAVPAECEKHDADEKELFPYHAKYLLTKNEWYFYKRLRPVAAKYGLCVLAKVRLADLVEVDNYLTGNGFYKYFSKIMAKHVDFVLCNPENLSVKLIMELDDSTHHATADRASRDDFVDKVLKQCGYTIIHTYGNANLEELFEKILKN